MHAEIHIESKEKKTTSNRTCLLVYQARLYIRSRYQVIIIRYNQLLVYDNKIYTLKFSFLTSSEFKLHSSIVIDRYSNFGNTYLSKEFARVLGTGQIVTSLEHLEQCRGGSSDVTMWSGPNTRAAILTNKYFQKQNYENIHHKMRSCYLTHKKKNKNNYKKPVKSVASLELEC